MDVPGQRRSQKQNSVDLLIAWIGQLKLHPNLLRGVWPPNFLIRSRGESLWNRLQSVALDVDRFHPRSDVLQPVFHFDGHDFGPGHSARATDCNSQKNGSQRKEFQGVNIYYNG